MHISNRWTVATALALGLGALGCTGGKPPEVQGVGACMPGQANCKPLTAGIDVALTENGLTMGETVSKVNFVFARDLWIRTKLPGRPQLTQVSLTLINPRGEISYEDRTPYSADPTIKETDSTLGHPITVFPAKSIPGGYALDRPIPVAGSVLQRIPAPEGIWEIQAVVDGISDKLIFSLEVINRR